MAQHLLIFHEDLVAQQVNVLWQVLQHCDPALAALRGPEQLDAAAAQAIAMPMARDSGLWVSRRREWLARLNHLLAQLIGQGRIALAEDQRLMAWLLEDQGPRPAPPP